MLIRINIFGITHNLYMKKLWHVLLLLAAACKQKEYNANILVKNAVVYTVDNKFSMAQAFVVKGGKIIAVGNADTIEQKYLAKEVIDAKGKAVYPGFIDAHTHFYRYGLTLQQVNLKGTKTWAEVVDSVKTYAGRN